MSEAFFKDNAKKLQQVWIEKRVHKQLKIEAMMAEITMSEYINSILKKHLRKSKKKKKPSAIRDLTY